MRRAGSKRLATRNLARSHAALSGEWPDSGRPSELRTKSGQDDDPTQHAYASLMRVLVVAIVFLIGCHGGSGRAADAGGGTDHLEEIFDEVDGARITQTLRELSG